MTYCEKKEMKDIRIRCRIRKEDIAYVDALFESYENFGVVTTIDPKEAIIVLSVSPSFFSETKELLTALKKEIELEIIK